MYSITLSPVQVASSLNLMMNGTEADTMDVDGDELSIEIEYPKDEFADINQVENILLTSSTGASVLLKDIAEIRFEDSPETLTRVDKQYQAQITADYTEAAGPNVRQELYDTYVRPNLTNGVSEAENAMTEMMNEEFGNLYTCLMVAVFLVFVVMAAQFESPKFSFMVMATIPFGLIGSFFLLWVVDVKITMVELIGFLMLIGTVVNNGILYVDTVNQYRAEGMNVRKALIEAGATRLRPIMMTTLTTVLSMLPLAVGYGDSGELMQGLALVSVGGLTASTIMALLVLPVYYTLMTRKKAKKLQSVDVNSYEM